VLAALKVCPARFIAFVIATFGRDARPFWTAARAVTEIQPAFQVGCHPVFADLPKRRQPQIDISGDGIKSPATGMIGKLAV
jgi:hypothetical protein